MKLNKNNFIVWSNSTAETPIERTRLGGAWCTPCVVWAVGETMSIYFNHINKSAATGVVSLHKLDGTQVAANVGSLTNLNVVGGNHSYGTLTCPSVANGLYQLKMSSGTIVSNVIEIVQAATQETCVMQFRHSGMLKSRGGYYVYPAGFSCKFRLRAIVWQLNFEDQREIYEEITTLEQRSTAQKSIKSLRFKVEYCDDAAIEAFSSMLIHDTLTINGKPIAVKEGISFEDFDSLESVNTILFEVFDIESNIASVI